jgi:hypothetical protein
MLYDPGTVFDICARYGLGKEASLAMLKRFHEFNRLAEHANPQVQAIGKKLVEQNARQIPKPFKPMVPAQPIVKLNSFVPPTVQQTNKINVGIEKAMNHSKLKPGITGPTGL